MTAEYQTLLPLLSELLDSSQLDKASEAQDCLDVFEDYEWIMKPGSNEDRFGTLYDKGISGSLSVEELDEFCDMASLDGEHHLYLTIREACKAVELLKAGEEHQETATTSVTVADFEIQDWHICEFGEQSTNTKQVYFRIYSTSLENLNEDLTQNGLAGMIEIRNGKPGICLGADEGHLPLHIEWDIHKGLFIHYDNDNKVSNSTYQSFDHGMIFSGYHVDCMNEDWLSDARKDLAEKIFSEYDFGEQVIKDTGSWDIDNTEWKRSVFFENPNSETSVKRTFTIIFGEGSIMPVNLSLTND